MMTMHKKRGPRPLSYIPQPFRHIPGVEQVTTPRQLERLRNYMRMAEEERPPFIRLGASVPQYSEEVERKPSCTYAVTVDGIITVHRREQDPRAAERWFRNDRRPWNLAAQFRSPKGRRANEE